MNLLLDTHALIWWLNEPAWLSPKALAAMEANNSNIFVSAVSAWEIATKHRAGRLIEGSKLVSDFDSEISADGFQPLSITTAHVVLAATMPGAHRDPFDRMLAAQARIENLVLLSKDKALDAFGIQRLW